MTKWWCRSRSCTVKLNWAGVNLGIEMNIVRIIMLLTQDRSLHLLASSLQYKPAQLCLVSTPYSVGYTSGDMLVTLKSVSSVHKMSQCHVTSWTPASCMCEKCDVNPLVTQLKDDFVLKGSVQQIRLYKACPWASGNQWNACLKSVT